MTTRARAMHLKTHLLYFATDSAAAADSATASIFVKLQVPGGKCLFSGWPYSFPSGPHVTAQRLLARKLLSLKHSQNLHRELVQGLAEVLLCAPLGRRWSTRTRPRKDITAGHHSEGIFRQCVRKGPQLRTWSSWGPNCWNGPHLVLILHKRPHLP